MSDPITREETFLAAAAGDSVTLPEPITRVEQYLKRIAERIGTGGGSPDSPQNANAKTVESVVLTEEVGTVELKIPYSKLPVNVVFSMDLQGSDANTDANVTNNNLTLGGTTIARDMKILPTKAQKETAARVSRFMLFVFVDEDAILGQGKYVNVTNGEQNISTGGWHLHHEPENGEIAIKFETWNNAMFGIGSKFRMAVI